MCPLFLSDNKALPGIPPAVTVSTSNLRLYTQHADTVLGPKPHLLQTAGSPGMHGADRGASWHLRNKPAPKSSWCFLTLVLSATDFIPSTDGLKSGQRVNPGFCRLNSQTLPTRNSGATAASTTTAILTSSTAPRASSLRALKCTITYDLVQAGNPWQGHLTLAPRVSWDLRAGLSEQSLGNHRNALFVRGVSVHVPPSHKVCSRKAAGVPAPGSQQCLRT